MAIFFLVLPFLQAQDLILDSCQQWARQNYPLIKQYDLINKSEKYNLNNASKKYLPQLSLSARATYQSDVTSIEIPEQLQGMFDLEALSKDQYQAQIEVNQLIWDGGLTSSKKKLTKAESQIDRQKVEVELYAINDRVNQLFFGILLLNEQEKQLNLLSEELQRNYEKIGTFVENGVANEADLDALKVEQLNINQQKIQLKTSRKTYLQMLSMLTGVKIDESKNLQKPKVDFLSANDNNRPEIKLFDAQSKSFESQRALLNASNMPFVGAFLQGGYGKPGLNMLKNEFSPFYIGGVSFKWNLSNLYSRSDDLRKIEIGQHSVAVQKETFLFNQSMLTEQQKNEVDKMQQLIADDDEIIRLRENIKKSSEVKVANGTLTVTDLIRDINAESIARQNKAMHEIQLLLSVCNYKYTQGN